MTSLRVLWLTDSLALGGAERLTSAFASGLDPERVDLRVAFLKSLAGNPLEDDLRRQGVPVTGIHARNLRDVRAFRRLVRLLREEEIQVIHAHLAYASIWGSLAGAFAGIPTISTFHVAPPEDPAWSREGIRRSLRVRCSNKFCRRLVTVSRAVAESWIRKGLDPEKVEVIHNGIPPEDYSDDENHATRNRCRETLGISPDTPVILTVSVLREGKGLPDLLAAFGRRIASGAPGILVVAGEGPLRESLEARARELGLGEIVRFLGYRRDVPALLAAADVFVLPSHRDAFPTAILEAMAAGLPVIATRAGGIPEIVEDDLSGLLVPPGSPRDLAEALGRVLGDPALARRLGEAGRRRVRERFSLDTWRDRLCSLYEEVA